VTGRAGRSERRKHNHLFSREIREENFVFADEGQHPQGEMLNFFLMSSFPF
jgi:hypothetical protein